MNSRGAFLNLPRIERDHENMGRMMQGMREREEENEYTQGFLCIL